MAASARKVTAMFVSKIPWTVSSSEFIQIFTCISGSAPIQEHVVIV